MLMPPLDDPWSMVDETCLETELADFDLLEAERRAGPTLPAWAEDEPQASVAQVVAVAGAWGPCSESVAMLEALTSRELTEDEWLSVAVEWRSMLSWAEGMQLAAIAAFAGQAPPSHVSAQGIARGEDLDFAAAELGMAFGVARESALSLVHRARALYGRAPEQSATADDCSDAGLSCHTCDDTCATTDICCHTCDDACGTAAATTEPGEPAPTVGSGGEGLLVATGQALLSGRLDAGRARLLTERLAELDPDQARAAESKLLPGAMRGSLSDLRRRIRYRLDKLDPDAALARWAEARARRGVETDTQGHDGLIGLYALLSPVEGLAVAQRLEQLAGPYDADDGRSKDERIADALVHCVLSSPAGAHDSTPASPVAVTLNVTVDLHTLLGLRHEPAQLHGFGPIPAQAARALAGDGTWRRWVHDPVTGHLLDAGTTRYRPNAELERFLRARDDRCRFPGCTRSARRADLDHTQAFNHGSPDDGGRTSAANLAALCRWHHRVKTHGDLTVTNHGDGRLTWTTRDGRTYQTRAHDYRPDPEDPPDTRPS